ncbi:protein DMR6-LIKE OXYGENASE 1-like isoform X2 [Chenopodium quinoa]|nr:protein DMR6-LIKE OXYGENASE 1-like isoform X2 [Chenopodium quinoa]
MSGNVFKWANSDDSDSSTSSPALSLTPNYILPVERRPNLAEVSKSGDSVPIIDMGRGDIDNLVKEIARASEEYGLFLIINHGVTEELCESMLSAVTDLFHLPPQVKARLVSDDPTKDVRICNHFRKAEDKGNQMAKKFSMWSEVFKHSWHPADDSFAELLPSDPPNYRRVVTAYAKEIGFVMSLLLNLMSQGLGLEGDVLQDRLGKNPLFRAQANYYPPCSNPDLTLGLGVHTDRDALTVVLPTSNVEGLQIMKDNKWIVVDPVPNALIVNIGDQLQVLSNGKYKSVLHRVVTNEHQSRVSLAMFYGPDKDALIGPIENLIDNQHPQLYRNYYFKEFLVVYRNQEGKNRKIKEFFEI